MKKILLLGAGLLVTALNTNAMEQHVAPFIGINVIKDKCHIIAEEDAFTYQGNADTKLTMNKNFALATCKADYLVDEDMLVELEGRVNHIPCRIGIPGTGFFDGTGGFTVSQDGVVTGNCKASK